MQINQSLIEAYANQISKRYNLSYPLNINSFVTTLGFEVKFVDTGTCDAYTIIYKGQKLILLNENISFQPRINFTLAHELGHYFIPTHLEPLYACNVNELLSTQYLDNPREEKEADIFASKLLLPSELAKEYSNIESLTDIQNVAQNYDISIPTTAIRLVKLSYDLVAFICCKNNRIDWIITSQGFKEHLKIRDLVKLPPPEWSTFNTCIEKNKKISKSKIPAYTWLENVESSAYIEEEVLYYPQYDTGYILIKADETLINED